MITVNVVIPAKLTLDLGPGVLGQLPQILALGAQIVASLADFNTKLDAIQTTIDAIKTEIADLKAQVAAGGLTAAEEQAVLDRIDTLQSNLTAAQ